MQLYEAKLFMQNAFILQVCVLVLHSSTSVQDHPFPLYPAWQAQLYAPTLFVQNEFILQLCVLVSHSSTSVQDHPLPS